jgi:hypothetical protein
MLIWIYLCERPSVSDLMYHISFRKESRQRTESKGKGLTSDKTEKQKKQTKKTKKTLRTEHNRTGETNTANRGNGYKRTYKGAHPPHALVVWVGGDPDDSASRERGELRVLKLLRYGPWNHVPCDLGPRPESSLRRRFGNFTLESHLNHTQDLRQRGGSGVDRACTWCSRLFVQFP